MNQRQMRTQTVGSALGHEEAQRALLRPLEHLEIAPQGLQTGLLKLIETLPLLIGDELYEALEEPHAGVNLERAISSRTKLCCELEPHAPQRDQAGSPPKRPISCKPRDCLVLISSQRSFSSPKAPRPRMTLKEALERSLARFKEQPELKLILIATDAWDAKLMKERLADFQAHLTRGQVMIPALHHGGLLTPITYL